MGDIEITVKTNFKATLNITKILNIFKIIFVMFIAAFFTNGENVRIAELFSHGKSVEKIVPKVSSENTRENGRVI